VHDYMEVRHFDIEGLVELQPKVWGDSRGYFFESYNQKSFDEAGIKAQFVQDNQSFSVAGTMRGLHFQKPPYAQGKLVRVITGKALDIAVDIRKGSPTFGKHVSVVLDSAKQNMFYLPEGFAHGFLALEDCIFVYKCTQLYEQQSEGGLLWNDTSIGIDWGTIVSPLVSDKDKLLPTMADLQSPFVQ
jgi:dTDP-4-dehydrorhamnose 3,5-epimerase